MAQRLQDQHSGIADVVGLPRQPFARLPALLLRFCPRMPGLARQVVEAGRGSAAIASTCVSVTRFSRWGQLAISNPPSDMNTMRPQQPILAIVQLTPARNG
jgi:hypothetical protein